MRSPHVLPRCGIKAAQLRDRPPQLTFPSAEPACRSAAMEAAQRVELSKRLEIVTVVVHHDLEGRRADSPRLRPYIRTPMGLLIFDQIWMQ
jgi:hypothetical protein